MTGNDTFAAPFLVSEAAAMVRNLNKCDYDELWGAFCLAFHLLGELDVWDVGAQQHLCHKTTRLLSRGA